MKLCRCPTCSLCPAWPRGVLNHGAPDSHSTHSHTSCGHPLMHVAPWRNVAAQDSSSINNQYMKLRCAALRPPRMITTRSLELTNLLPTACAMAAISANMATQPQDAPSLGDGMSLWHCDGISSCILLLPIHVRHMQYSASAACLLLYYYYIY